MSVTLKAGLGWGKSRKGSCVCAKDRGPGGHLCVEPRRGRAPGRGKGGNCRIPPTVVQTCQSGGWTGAGAKLEGRGAGSQGCAAQRPLSLHKHQARAHTDIPSELDSHRSVDRPRWAQRHTPVCPRHHTHTQIPDALTNTLRCTCGHIHPCFWFPPCVKCRDTASGWVAGAGPQSWALSTVYCPTGMTPPGSDAPLGQRSWSRGRTGADPLSACTRHLPTRASPLRMAGWGPAPSRLIWGPA